MTTPDLTALAEGLTEAQRRAVLTGCAVGGGKWPLRNALAGKGLASSMPFRLTPLGIALRAHLLATPTKESPDGK